MADALVKKYDVPVPRYTSYPAMPDWQLEDFNEAAWRRQIREGFAMSGEEGISMYIHLPYCESLCTYCGCNTRITINHAVELPYIKALLSEWKLYLAEFGEKPVLRELHLGGGTPTFFSPQNLRLLISNILETVTVHPDHSFSLEGHPGNTTFEHLKSLYKLGFRRVSFGIQDFDLKVQKAINRLQSYEQVEQVTQWARQLGYDSINYDLIYGLPFQTEASILHTVNLVSQLVPDRIAFYSYAHVPWFKPGQRAYSEKDLPKGDEKRALNDLGRAELQVLGYADIGMDHFALPTDSLNVAMQLGKLHRNFMGYTEQAGSFLVGLGASSISDSGLGYAQNVKVVEQYMELVNQGTLPVFKGHNMTETEQDTRHLILDIICNRWVSKQQVNALPEERQFQFIEMLEEGLLEEEWGDYRVTQLGTQYLRNICSVFDPYFGTERAKPTFSKAV